MYKYIPLYIIFSTAAASSIIIPLVYKLSRSSQSQSQPQSQASFQSPSLQNSKILIQNYIQSSDHDSLQNRLLLKNLIQSLLLTKISFVNSCIKKIPSLKIYKLGTFQPNVFHQIGTNSANGQVFKIGYKQLFAAVKQTSKYSIFSKSRFSTEIYLIQKSSQLVELNISPHFLIFYGLFECRSFGIYRYSLIFIELANSDLQHWLDIMDNLDQFKSTIQQLFLSEIAINFLGFQSNDNHLWNYVYIDSSSSNLNSFWFYQIVLFNQKYSFYVQNLGQLWTAIDFGIMHPFNNFSHFLSSTFTKPFQQIAQIVQSPFFINRLQQLNLSTADDPFFSELTTFNLALNQNSNIDKYQKQNLTEKALIFLQSTQLSFKPKNDQIINSQPFFIDFDSQLFLQNISSHSV